MLVSSKDGEKRRLAIGDGLGHNETHA
jgi:hypothetical protein